MSIENRLARALGPGYRVERLLGEGGMGLVYLVQDLHLSRPVAVKLLKPEMATARLTERFRKEARRLANLNHPNLITVHHVGQGEGLDYFVMEYLACPTLEERLLRGPLARRDALRVGREVLPALSVIHGAQLVHRDIKPSNIFFAEDQVVLGDLGIAQTVAEEDSSTVTTDDGAGTLDYMAPEQRARRRATPPTDIWALAAVLYECLTGERWMVASARVGFDPWKGVSWPLARALRRALAWEPSDRWESAGAFARALDRGDRLPRRLRWGVLGPVAAIAAGLIGWKYILQHQGCIPLEPSVSLTILPFRGADTARVTRLTRYTGYPLEPFSLIPVRPIPVVINRPPPVTPPDIACLNTTFYLEGEMSGDSLLELVVRDRAGRLLHRLRVLGSGGDLAWGAAAADTVVNRLFPGKYPAYHDVAGRGARDPQAVDAFLRGKEAFHRDAYRESEGYFDQAIDLDPGFALARWHLALAHRWRRTLSRRELEELWPSRDSLPDQYRLLLAAQLEPDLDRRFAAYREAIARYPTTGYAVLLYADELFHRGPLAGLPLDTAVTWMQRAAALDPFLDQAPAFDHTIWAAVRLGRARDADRELERRLKVARSRRVGGDDEGYTRTQFLRLSYWYRFSPWKARLALLYRFTRPDSLLLSRVASYVRLGTSFDIPDSQLELGRVLVRKGKDRGVIGLGFEAQGLALMALGRPGEALTVFDSAAAYFGSAESILEGAQWRLLGPLLGLSAADSAQRSRGLAMLARVADAPGVAARVEWTRAVETLAGGADPAPHLARLRALSPADPRAGRLLRLVQAMQAARRTGPDSALALSRDLVRYDPDLRQGDPFARAMLYLLRAGWLVDAGRLAEADRSYLWYENEDVDGWAEREAQAGDIDGAVSVVARVRRGRAALARGDTTAACGYLGRARQLWRGAEPPIVPLRDSVITALEACPHD
jgi:tetratricopeptide (TPR) repeat protein